jgi:hypothetical protein
MELIKATIENQLFSQLEAQWKGQLAEYDESLDDYIISFREHSQTVINGALDNYFVYVLSDNGAHIGFVHVNYAQIKRLPGYTIRALEIYLAPRYDYSDVSKEKMADICAGIFDGLYNLASDELRSANIKIHMGPLDKDYLIALANISAKSLMFEVIPQGMWLLIRK